MSQPHFTVFISGVSAEFASFREAAKVELENKDCHVNNQPSFPPTYLKVVENLRNKLGKSDAVIHIAGFCYGTEPAQRPVGADRRSYTQMEFEIAREMQMPVYVFMSRDESIRDAPDPAASPEDEVKAGLQQGHRQRIRASDYLYYEFKNKEEFCLFVARLQLGQPAGFGADISRLAGYVPATLIGREVELEQLRSAWLKARRGESDRANVIVYVALGGEGKTSLVAHWAAGLAGHRWQGCDRVFAWSFYNQGVSEQSGASSDLFLNEALKFFEAGDVAESNASIIEKARLLARLVGERRSLLLLDGLEPLQHSPGSSAPGSLKDLGMTVLLKDLAAVNQGLCVVTTRYEIPELHAFEKSTVSQHQLARLTKDDGVRLLKALQVNGTSRELEEVVERVEGHALTLNLLGSYLRRAFKGDVRQYHRVRFDKANDRIQQGHAFRVMAAYESWLLEAGEEGRREVAILRLMGLFDRPASAGCLEALRSEVIAGLNEPLVGISEDDWEFSLTGLSAARLVTLTRDPAGMLLAVDAHPLLRDYFARQVRQTESSEGSSAWRHAHRLLFEYLCSTCRDKARPDVEDLQPLYQAVSHGCHAGMQREAWENVFIPRIRRDGEGYSTEHLGAFGLDLGALACFSERFELEQPSSVLMPEDQAAMLYHLCICLRGLGRMHESVKPLRESDRRYAQLGRPKERSRVLRALANYCCATGQIDIALEEGRIALEQAVLSQDAGEMMLNNAAMGTWLRLLDQGAEARRFFEEAARIQAQLEPDCPVLCSWQARNCAELEFKQVREQALRHSLGYQLPHESLPLQPVVELCRRWIASSELCLERSSNQTLTARAQAVMTDFQARLYLHILTGEGSLKMLLAAATQAVDAFTASRRLDDLPLALIDRAWVRWLSGARRGQDSAHSDLDEVWQIALRGPMMLFQADVLLYRARMFHRDDSYPWGSAEKDLQEAEAIIEKSRYLRRYQELQDAKAEVFKQSGRV